MKNNFLKKLLRRFKTLTDQDIDKLYYNQYAQNLISKPIESYRLGLKAVPFSQQKVFEKYYDSAIVHITPGNRILELGAGVGVHTGILASRIRGGGTVHKRYFGNLIRSEQEITPFS